MIRFSRTVSSTSRASCWGTTPRRERICGPSRSGSMPITRSVPPLIGETHPIIRIVEVLPAPLGPRNPNDSPAATSKSTASTATNSPKRLVSPRAWMSGDVGWSDMSPESYTAGLSAVRDGPRVDGHDAAGHTDPGHVPEPGLAHDLGDAIGSRVALHAPHEVAIRATLAGHATDDRHDLVEPELQDPGNAALRPGDLEADDTAARPDRAGKLRESLAVIRQVAHPEGDRRGVKGSVLGRQRQRVADHVREAGTVGEPLLGDADHGR